MQEARVQFLGQKDPLEKELATHSSILARRIPRTKEPGGLQLLFLHFEKIKICFLSKVKVSFMQL